MSEILLTQEVGSLAKPDWRVLPFSQGRLGDEHIEQAIEWADRLGFNRGEPESILRRQQASLAETGKLTPNGENNIKYLSASYAVRLQEQAGIDIIFDGEQDRSEMYQHAIERTEGFEWRGRVRAFDGKSFKKAAVVDRPHIITPWHDDEVHRLRSLTSSPIKVPITGAYTLGAWSYDEYYADQGYSKAEGRRQLVLDMARYAIRPNIESLLAQGVEWIQIDEPAATTVPGEVPLFVESFNESVKGLVGKFSVHICFSDYSLLFPHISEMENCSQYSLEFANRDSRQLGTDKADRPDYEILQELKTYAPDAGIGLGVTSVHDNDIETPQLVRDRVLRVVDIMRDPTKVYPSPDCGLRTRSWNVAHRKLQATAEGTQLAREALGG